MGTYTANYNLYMPSIGEQGWGDLVNGNFITIDTAMSGLNIRMGTAESNITSLTTRMGTAETTIISNTSRIGTLETETNAIDARVTVLENGEFNGEVSAETFDGDLYINLTATNNYVFGTYEVTVNSDSATTTFNIPTGRGGATYGKVSATISGISMSTKKGFKGTSIPDITVSATMTTTHTYNMTGILKIYLNNTLANSVTVTDIRSPTVSTSFIAKIGDIISAEFQTRTDSNYSTHSNVKNTITFSNITGNLYLG